MISQFKLEERLRNSSADSKGVSLRTIFDKETIDDPASEKVSFGTIEGSMHYHRKKMNQKFLPVLMKLRFQVISEN